MNYWTTASGFFISGFVFLSFLPVVTTVASWIVLIICTGLLSFHTCICYVTFPVECCLLVFSVFSFPFQVWWHALVSPHSTTNSCLSVAMFNLSHYYKNCLDGYDDSGLCFCLEVMVLRSLSSSRLCVSPCDGCNLILLHALFSSALGYFLWIEHLVIFFGLNT